MAELSKTARAAENAVNRGKRVEKVERTSDQIIRDVRNHLASGLYIISSDIAVLLAAYDAERKLAREFEARLTAALDVPTQVRAITDLAGWQLSEPLVIKAEPGLDPATQNLDSTGN